MRGFISTTVEPLIYGTRGLLIVRFAHLVFPFDYLLEPDPLATQPIDYYFTRESISGWWLVAPIIKRKQR